VARASGPPIGWLGCNLRHSNNLRAIPQLFQGRRETQGRAFGNTGNGWPRRPHLMSCSRDCNCKVAFFVTLTMTPSFSHFEARQQLAICSEAACSRLAETQLSNSERLEFRRRRPSTKLDKTVPQNLSALLPRSSRQPRSGLKHCMRGGQDGLVDFGTIEH